MNKKKIPGFGSVRGHISKISIFIFYSICFCVNCLFSCLFVYIFTGVEGEDVTARQSTNAYMLVYIRKTSLKDVLCPVTDVDIPQELSDRLNAEKQMEIVKRKEKTESHLYMTVRILYEDHFYGHQGNDLYETDKVTYQEIRVKKQDPLR